MEEKEKSVLVAEQADKMVPYLVAIEAARRTAQTCKEATGMHKRIDEYVNPNYIASKVLADHVATPADAGDGPATKAQLTDERIRQVVAEAVRDGSLSWLGFDKDSEGRYTIPVLSPYHYRFARAIECEVLARLSTPAAQVTDSDAPGNCPTCYGEGEIPGAGDAYPHNEPSRCGDCNGTGDTPVGQSPAPVTASNDLHNAIMNLPCYPVCNAPHNEQIAYRKGHRDARHAAAELAVLATPADAGAGLTDGEINTIASNFGMFRYGYEQDPAGHALRFAREVECEVLARLSKPSAPVTAADEEDFTAIGAGASAFAAVLQSRRGQSDAIGACENRATLAARPGQPAAPTDADIEQGFQSAGGRWDGDYWVIEDADLHPYVRSLLGQLAGAAPASAAPVSQSGAQVPSIDTPEFRELMEVLIHAYDQWDEDEPVPKAAREAWLALVAHINSAKLTPPVQVPSIASNPEFNKNMSGLPLIQYRNVVALVDRHIATQAPVTPQALPTIDTPEFNRLLGEWMESREYYQSEDQQETKDLWAVFIAHIDAQLNGQPAASHQPSGDPSKDLVTIESALEAVRHVHTYNGLGRMSEAVEMLVRVPAASLPATSSEATSEGWQPISTVPMDGSEVLLYLPAPYSRVAKARWFDIWENWIEGDLPDPNDEYCGIGSRLPTHWMPLPAAPATSAATAGGAK